MADAILTLSNGSVFSMVYSYLPSTWKPSMYGKLVVEADKCNGGNKTTYNNIPVMLYNDYLYVWLCSPNAHQKIAMKSLQPFSTSVQNATINCDAFDLDGREVWAEVTISGSTEKHYTPCAIQVKPGNYTIVAVSSGHKLTKSISVKSGEILTLDFHFGYHALPPTMKAYGVEFQWPKDATDAIAFKIWNPLGIDISSILNRAFQYADEISKYGYKLLGSSHYAEVTAKDNIIVFWFEKYSGASENVAEDIGLGAIVALILAVVLVGIIVYGWVTVTRTKANEYSQYVQSKEKEAQRIEDMCKQGLLTKEQCAKLLNDVENSSNNPPPNNGNEGVDWGSIAKTGAIIIGLGLAGGLLLKFAGNRIGRGITEVVVPYAQKAKNAVKKVIK